MSNNVRMLMTRAIAGLVVLGATTLAWPGVASAATAVPIGPQGKSLSYFHCAAEGATCSFSGEKYVAYGANGSFFFRRITGPFGCNNATFGDPIGGVAKACYFANYGLNAAENGTSSTVGLTEVAYGANGTFHFRTINGPYTCDNATFGDPIPGVAKACFIALPSYSSGAVEGGTMSNLNQTPVAYGANGKFIYTIASGSMPCTNAAFGGDPAPFVPKVCYRFNSAFLVSEASAYSISVPAVVLYGSGLNGAYLHRFNSTGSCTTAFFGGDPDAGVLKHCFWFEFRID